MLANRSVEQVASALRISASHLRRLVLADVGLLPKVYQQVLRRQRFVHAIDPGTSLAAAAAATGYADQPHLTRDVRRFFGAPPSRLAAERRST
jgi:methylphosphotriester-DNA--protein-cysteine methyltransferase